MTTHRLRRIGEAIYGAEWVSPMARDLSVNLRTMQRWAAGDTAPPDTVFADLKLLAARGGAELRARLAAIDEFLAD